MSISSAIKNLFSREKTIPLEDTVSIGFSYMPGPIRITDHAHQQEVAIKPTIANPVLGYKEGVRSKFLDDYEEVEYDLGYILRAEDSESYLRQAHEKKLTLFFKEGYAITGENEKTVTYIKKRLRQIAEATNISTDRLLRGTASDLIKMSNSFWYLARNEKKSGGKTVNKVKPVAGIFIIPADTILVKTKNNGQVVSIRQKMPSGRKKTYSKRNVFHFAIDRKSGFSVGTPRSWPAIEDILALRRIEENIEKLIHRDLFPIYQYKVGTETMPCKMYSGGYTELDEVRALIKQMPPEGIYVTPERHEIKVVGQEGKALRAEGYLKHFKQRVLSGIGMSSVDVGEGEGASKSSAETMSQGLIDEVKGVQTVFEDLFDNLLIRVLLKESTFSFDVTAPENMVHLVFKEIDTATQVKMENHNAQLFSQYAINHDELMLRLGRTPADDAWWEKSYWKLIEEPKSLLIAADEPFSPAAQALAEASNTAIQPEQLTKAQSEREKMEKTMAKAKSSAGAAATTKASRGSRAGKAQDKPQNQHGKKLEPITRTNSLYLSDITKQKVFEVFNIARSDAINLLPAESAEWRSALLDTAREEFKNRLNPFLRQYFYEGYHSITLGISANSVNAFNILENYAWKYVDKIFLDIQEGTLPAFTKETVSSVFDSIEYRVSFLLDTEAIRSSNFGILVALRELNVTQGRFENSSEGCDICDRMTQETHDLDELGLASIPPHHPNCGCKLIGVFDA